jgi:RNA polymerase sigma-70 factor (ECF subfamily)
MVQSSMTTDDAPPEGADGFQGWLHPYLPSIWLFVCRFAPSHSREDVYQSALLSAWSKRQSYDGSRSGPRTWLLLLTADQCRKARRGLLRPLAAPLRAEPEADVDAGIDVRRAVADLSKRQRVAIELFYVMDLPVTECALLMGCSVGTVKSTLFDARRLLRRILEETND